MRSAIYSSLREETYTLVEAANRLGYATGGSIRQMILRGELHGIRMTARKKSRWLVPRLEVEQLRREMIKQSAQRFKAAQILEELKDRGDS